ncbi:uncharacterized protein CG45076-like isoform X2 [Acanthaster planci]|uniref:Uncharacterized protein CG45076-like isoform X2 n=1 Tax=Acanthaster planci TaxID=133434 RepID=A0A8B7ZRV6_ACAPL|nr:uncharacterized protein CG45076-like isoform X2 [Acanthaster planci]
MPAAQKFIPSEGMSGVVNLKRSSKGRKGEGKWKKKYAVLKQDTLHLYEGHDENGRGEDESYTIYLSKYKECTHIVDKRGRKKPSLTIIPIDPTYEQWMLSCEDTSQQETWISHINSAISGNLITINFNLDEVMVQSPALQHLNKTRPKCKGRRAPSKRPRTTGITTVDAVNPAKKRRSDMMPTTTTSPVKTPEESKTSAARAFFRGLGQKVTTALTRQKSTGAKTPQSPEPPEGVSAQTSMEVAPEDRMSLSALMRTLQRIEETSGTIVNKAAALRILFQGAAEDSASLGRPALEVEKGLQGIEGALEHLNLAEEFQTKIKEDEAREKLTKEEVARKKQEEEEAQREQEEEERRKREAEEAEQRRRDEEEQELQDEEDRKREEERLRREAEEKRAQEEALRLAEEAGEEEEKMWESGDEKAQPEDEEGPAAPEDGTQEAPQSSHTQDDAGPTIATDNTAMKGIDAQPNATEESLQETPTIDKDGKEDEEEAKMDTSNDATEEAGEETEEGTDKQEPAAEDEEGELSIHL